jgi:hypothetical protein
MLERHVQNARAMLGNDGLLIWGSIPERKFRKLYESGRWSGVRKARQSRLLKSWIYRLVGLDAMGYWYEPAEIADVAHKYGLHARIVPSEVNPYRFHAVLSKSPLRNIGTLDGESPQSPTDMVRVVQIAE